MFNEEHHLPTLGEDLSRLSVISGMRSGVLDSMTGHDFLVCFVVDLVWFSDRNWVGIEQP